MEGADIYRVQAREILSSTDTLLFGNEPAQRALGLATAVELGERAVFISAPPEADRVPYLLLAAAAQCGASEAVARHLERGAIADAAAALERAMRDRVLVLVGVDLLRGREGDELANAFEADRDALRVWLRRRDGGARVEPKAWFDPRPAVPAGPVLTALWRDVKGDVSLFQLALVRHALLGSAAEALDPLSLVDEVWMALPEELRAVARLLSVHGRPMRLDLLRGMEGLASDAVDEAVRIGLVDCVKDEATLPRAFAVALQDRMALSAVARAREHRRLAEAHAGDALRGAALSHLEAHRHFSAAGDLGRAAEFARYSVAMLLDAARRTSIEALQLPEPERGARLAQAVDAYDTVLALGRGGAFVPPRAVAYAKHYRSYNRYKRHDDPVAVTINGYRDALESWPENALFWSRLIRAYAVSGDLAAAEGAQREAYDRVPPHQERDVLLRARVVERLASRGFWLRALALAGGALRSYAGERLLARLRKGVTVNAVEATGGLVVLLARPVTLVLLNVDGAFHAVLPGWEAQATSARGAVAELARALMSSPALVVGADLDPPAEAGGLYEPRMAQMRHAWGHRHSPVREALLDTWVREGAAGLSWLVWRVAHDADPDELLAAADALSAAGERALPFVLAALEGPIRHDEGGAMLLRVLGWSGVRDDRVAAIVQRFQSHPNEDLREACAELAMTPSSPAE
ncbi:MAG: hypothetical protein R3A52_00140 [Polyangiales bacterium]